MGHRLSIFNLKGIAFSVLFVAFQNLGLCDINSTSGNIDFDVDNDGTIEATLTNNGLGVGTTTASANLHVLGNTIIGNTVSVGTSTATSTLEIKGTLAYGMQTVTDNLTLEGNSFILADTNGGGNITIKLPSASSMDGRQYTIKAAQISDKVNVISNLDLGIDGSNGYELSSVGGALPFISLMSGSKGWNLTAKSPSGINAATVSGNATGYWNFNETDGTTATDKSGAGLSGTLTNGLSFSGCSISGNVSTALSFDGTDDYIALGTNDFIGDGNYSVSAWFSTTATQTGIIFEAYTGGGIAVAVNRGCVGNTPGNLSFTGGNSGITCFTHSVGASLYNGSWYHVAFVRTSDTQGSIYFNGSLLGTGALESGSHLKSVNANIGTATSAGGLFFKGAMDDLRLYNRALSATEVAQLYSLGQ